MQAGDQAARDELLRGFSNRLERLARKMLHRFPSVRRWADTGDVLQNSLLRLLRALEQVHPTTTQEFFGLAAEQMRRELLDLARHYYGRYGLSTNHASVATGDDPRPQPDPAEQTEGQEDLERWCAFHQEVEKLPAEDRQVVELIFYHGWMQAEVAELLGMTVRTVQRRWQAALMKLHRVLGDTQL
jgi:RNA polymerase sigma-70 factor (ECF subfamily)